MTALGLVGDPAQVATLAVDGGQSGLRMRATYGAQVAEVAVEGFAYPRGGTPGESATVVADLLERAWRELPDRARRATPSRAALGLTGELGDPATVQALAQAVGALTAAAEVRLAHDSVTAHLGAFSGGPGVVVASGTGVVALGVSASGGVRRVDGWGYLLGDGGSGFAVGRAALRAVCAAADGRGQATELSDVVGHLFGDVSGLPDRLYRSASMVADVASMTIDVARVARGGDPVARAIWSRAVDDLVETTVAAARDQPGGPIRGVGGMFAVADLLERPWAEQVRRRLPGCTVVPTGDTPNDVGPAYAGIDDAGTDDAGQVSSGQGDLGLEGAALLASARQLGQWRRLLWYAGAPA